MANEVARAYVLIVPSMEGARGAISEELTGAGEEAGRSAGSRAGSAFSGALGTAARVGAAAVSAVERCTIFGGSFRKRHLRHIRVSFILHIFG